MAKERLQKYIANCGYCSRRKAELLIEAGLVHVDGVAVRELGVKVDPDRQEVMIHGERIVPTSFRAIALHKPAGFITSTHDTHDRLTVMDLLPRRIAETGVLPAGRLDLETEGLLILTNDGDLQHRITHPRYECVKEYYVELDRAPSRDDLGHLERGIYLHDLDRETAPAELFEVDRRRDGTATLKIRIREGMKRQIRRMFQELGMTVVYLKRLSVGAVLLADLPRGEWRELTTSEISSLADETATARPAPRPKNPARRERAESRDDSFARGGSDRRRSGDRRSDDRRGDDRRSVDRHSDDRRSGERRTSSRRSDDRAPGPRGGSRSRSGGRRRR